MRSRLVLAVLALAALLVVGCSPAPAATTQPPATEAPTEATEKAPEATATPTEEPTITPTPTPEIVPITKDNVGKLREVRSISVGDAPIGGASFSPIDHTVATFDFDRTIYLWDADSGKQVATLGNMADYGFGLAFSPDGKLLASGATGGDLRLWDVAGRSQKVKMTGGMSYVYKMAWSPDGSQVAAVGQESSRALIFGPEGQKVGEVKVLGGWLWSVAFSNDYLAVSNDTGHTVVVYDAKTYASVKELYHPGFPALAMAFSPDGSKLVSCHRDGILNVWSTSDWSLVKTFPAHPGVPSEHTQGCAGAAFSKDGSVLFTSGDDGMVNAWDLETGGNLKNFSLGSTVYAVTVSGDGTLVAASDDDGTLHIYGLK